MKNDSLASLVLAEVIYHAEEALIAEQDTAGIAGTKNPTEICRKYYVGASAQSVLTMRGASSSLLRLQESLSMEQTESDLKVPKDDKVIDVAWSMRCMDVLFKASFADFVSDERNVECIGVRTFTLLILADLLPLIKDYKMRQVAQGLEWMTRTWKSENAAKLLRVVFAQWLPDLAGVVFAIVSQDWDFTQGLSLCAAFLLMREKAGISGTFVATWAFSRHRRRDDPEIHALQVTELISYLDAVLEWKSGYFQEFTSAFFKCYKELVSAYRTVKFPILVQQGLTVLEIGKLIKKEEDQSQLELGLLLASLSKFYQSSLATSYKMALKTFKSASLPKELMQKRDDEVADLLGLDLEGLDARMSLHPEDNGQIVDQEEEK